VPAWLLAATHHAVQNAGQEPQCPTLRDITSKEIANASKAFNMGKTEGISPGIIVTIIIFIRASRLRPFNLSHALHNLCPWHLLHVQDLA
jgi:hypothetical protein